MFIRKAKKSEIICSIIGTYHERNVLPKLSANENNEDVIVVLTDFVKAHH